MMKRGQAAALVDRLDAKLEQELELEREERRELGRDSQAISRKRTTPTREGGVAT